MQNIEPLVLDAIRARYDAAPNAGTVVGSSMMRSLDRALISLQDIPDLIAEVERLRAAVELTSKETK